jgi:(2R)-ethylmalonyl-CoA mutase
VELDKVLGMGGAIAAVENAYMKQRLVEAHTARVRAIEAGTLPIVGVNVYQEHEPSPLLTGSQAILTVDESAERQQIERLRAFRAKRNAKDVEVALRNLRDAAANRENLMPASIGAAHAGVTTGEWADTLRALFGEYRAPTGVAGARAAGGGAASAATDRARALVRSVSAQLGRPLKILVGKPGLDGHSNGAEQIAVKARDVGMEVVYEGIRLTPQEIVQSARDEGVHVIGLSILSGSHLVLVIDVMERLRKAGLGALPVVVGGIIPESDAERLRAAGVRRVYTPKDFDLARIMEEIAELAAEPPAAA